MRTKVRFKSGDFVSPWLEPEEVDVDYRYSRLANIGFLYACGIENPDGSPSRVRFKSGEFVSPWLYPGEVDVEYRRARTVNIRFTENPSYGPYEAVDNTPGRKLKAGDVVIAYDQPAFVTNEPAEKESLIVIDTVIYRR